MQISAIRNNNKYGRKKQPRMHNGPRQERNNNKGPPSSYTNFDMSRVRCWNCGHTGHRADQCRKAKRVQISMLTTSLSPIANDDAEVNDLNSEGAVDPAIQADVPLDLQAALPIYQERTGMRQPIQTMVVARQNSANDRWTAANNSVCRDSSIVPAGGAPRVDEHVDREGPCVHANLPEAEQVGGWYTQEDNHQPREDPRRRRIRTNETSGASRQNQSTRRQRYLSTRSTCLNRALQATYVRI